MCVSSDRGKIPRLFPRGDARGFGRVGVGFREDEQQMTLQRLVLQHMCPQQPPPASHEVLFLELDLVCCTGII